MTPDFDIALVISELCASYSENDRSKLALGNEPVTAVPSEHGNVWPNMLPVPCSTMLTTTFAAFAAMHVIGCCEAFASTHVIDSVPGSCGGIMTGASGKP